MKDNYQVFLSSGKTSLVSPEDIERVRQYKWSATMNAARGREKWYAHRKAKVSGRRVTLYLHRYIVQEYAVIPPGWVVDHINGDGLDNRRENLRVVEQNENTRHCRFKRGHTGVAECYL